jgi:hypothetical protein
MKQPDDPKLDPQELFAFLANHDTYPVSGLMLANEARSDGCSSDLVDFFEALPGMISSEADIVTHAMRPDEAPLHETLDVSGGDATPPYIPEDQATLQIDDITQE